MDLVHKDNNIVKSSGKVDFLLLEGMFDRALKQVSPSATARFVGSTSYLGSLIYPRHVSDIDYAFYGAEIKLDEWWLQQYYKIINSILGDEGHVGPFSGSSIANATYVAALKLTRVSTLFPLHMPLLQSTYDEFLRCRVVSTIIMWRQMTDKNLPEEFDPVFSKQHPEKTVKRCIGVLGRIARSQEQKVIHARILQMYLDDESIDKILEYIKASGVLVGIAQYMMGLEQLLGVSEEAKDVFQSERVGDAANEFVAYAATKVTPHVLATYPDLVRSCK